MSSGFKILHSKQTFTHVMLHFLSCVRIHHLWPVDGLPVKIFGTVRFVKLGQDNL